ERGERCRDVGGVVRVGQRVLVGGRRHQTAPSCEAAAWTAAMIVSSGTASDDTTLSSPTVVAASTASSAATASTRVSLYGTFSSAAAARTRARKLSSLFTRRSIFQRSDPARGGEVM